MRFFKLEFSYFVVILKFKNGRFCIMISGYMNFFGDFFLCCGVMFYYCVKRCIVNNFFDKVIVVLFL